MSRKAKTLEARDALEGRIGYTFADKAILDRALTHISAAAPKQGRGGSYQRLEFLGDHVLGLAVSDMLYRAYPKGDEGELSRRLADLVRRESCADVARAIDLGAALRLGSSESNAGGRRRTATLADVCEALIGAVFVDGGYPAAAALIERLWRERMLKPQRPLRDPKTMLQEWGAGTRAAHARLSRGGAHGAAPQSALPRRRRCGKAHVGGGRRTLQACRRAGRGGRDAHARRCRHGRGE